MAGLKEVGVRIRIGTAGLEGVDKLIRALKDAGAETDEFESDAQQLNTALQRLGREQAAVDQFVKLKREGGDAAKALQEAQARTRELALEMRGLETPTKAQTTAFEKSKTAARDAAKAVQDNKLALQNARGALTEVGIASDQLAAAQVRLKTQITSATARATNLREELARQAGVYKEAAAAATTAGAQQEAAAKKAAKAVKELKSDVDGTGVSLGKLGGLAAGAFTGQEFVQTIVQAESLNRGLTAVFGSAQAGGKEFEYLKRISNELGLELLSTGRAYLNLAASTQGTNLEGQATREIFEAVSRAMSTLGKSSAETEGALRAVGQMASKGTVSMEELRGQLGEALPGALKAAADGMGVTVQQLVEMVSNGEVLASDLLPRLAKGLNDLYANGSPPDTLIANWNRLKNTVSETAVVINDNGIGTALTKLTGVGAVALAALSDAFVNGAKTYGEFAGAIRTGDPSLIGFGERMNESIERLKGLAQTAGLTAPDALNKLEDGAKGAGGAVADMGGSVTKSAKSYDELLKAVDDAQKKVDDLSRKFVNERATANEVRDATDKLTKAKKDLTEASDKQAKQSDLVVKGLKAETEYSVKLLQLEIERLKVKRDDLIARGLDGEAKKVSISIAELELKVTQRATLGKRQEANEIIRSETLRQQELQTRGLLTPEIKAESDLRILGAKTTLAEADAVDVNSQAREKHLTKVRNGTASLEGNSQATQTNTQYTRTNTGGLEDNIAARERAIAAIDEEAAAQRKLAGLSTLRQAGDPSNKLALDGGTDFSVLGASKIGPTGSSTYTGTVTVPPPDNSGNYEWKYVGGYGQDGFGNQWVRKRGTTPEGTGAFVGSRMREPAADAESAGQAEIERRSSTSAGYTITFVIGGRRRAVTAESQSAAEGLVRDLEEAFRQQGGG